MTPEEQRFFNLSLEAGHVFNPSSPVSEKDLFSGRKEQIRRVLDVVFQQGQHAIIFGERGVGKTSLANVLEGFFPPGSKAYLETRVNCDSQDTFYSVWRKVFDKMNLSTSSTPPGFNQKVEQVPFNSEALLSSEVGAPAQVLNGLIKISESITPVVILDEFDRLQRKERRLFADFIKTLSDQIVDATLILVGVGNSVDDLIHEHESLSRNLVQVQMPRMNPSEIEDVIIKGLGRLGMKIVGSVLQDITKLTKGLPHYAHLIGLQASRAALDDMKLEVTEAHFQNAIHRAIQNSNQSIITAYEVAIRSAYKNNLFASVLWACAMAEVNELGEFAAQDLRGPMKQITGKEYDIPAYAQHLKEFSDPKRGNILIKSGTKRLFRYKFKDPLMQPFIFMKGIAMPLQPNPSVS